MGSRSRAIDAVIGAHAEVNVGAFNYASYEAAREAKDRLSRVAGTALMQEPDGSWTLMVATHLDWEELRNYPVGRARPSEVGFGGSFMLEGRTPPPPTTRVDLIGQAQRSDMARRGAPSFLSSMIEASPWMSARFQAMIASDDPEVGFRAMRDMLVDAAYAARIEFPGRRGARLRPLPTWVGVEYDQDWNALRVSESESGPGLEERRAMERAAKAVAAELRARLRLLRLRDRKGYRRVLAALGCDGARDEREEDICLSAALPAVIFQSEAATMYATVSAAHPTVSHGLHQSEASVVNFSYGGSMSPRDVQPVAFTDFITPLLQSHEQFLSRLGRDGAARVLRALVRENRKAAAAARSLYEGRLAYRPEPKEYSVGPPGSGHLLKTGGQGIWHDEELHSNLAAAYILASGVEDPLSRSSLLPEILYQIGASTYGHPVAYEWASDIRQFAATASYIMRPGPILIASDALANSTDPVSAKVGEHAMRVAEVYWDAVVMSPGEFASQFESQFDWRKTADALVADASTAATYGRTASQLSPTTRDSMFRTIGAGYWTWYGRTISYGDRFTTLTARREFLDKLVGAVALAGYLSYDVANGASAAATADLQALGEHLVFLLNATPGLSAVVPPPEDVLEMSEVFLRAIDRAPEPMAAPSSELTRLDPTRGETGDIWTPSGPRVVSSQRVVDDAYKWASVVTANPGAYDPSVVRLAHRLRHRAAPYASYGALGRVLPSSVRAVLRGEGYVMPGQIAHSYAQVSPWFRQLYEKHPFLASLATEAGPEMAVSMGAGFAASSGSLATRAPGLSRAAGAVSLIQTGRHLPAMVTPDPFNVLGWGARWSGLAGIRAIPDEGTLGRLARTGAEKMVHATDIAAPILTQRAMEEEALRHEPIPPLGALNPLEPGDREEKE